MTDGRDYILELARATADDPEAFVAGLAELAKREVRDGLGVLGAYVDAVDGAKGEEGWGSADYEGLAKLLGRLSSAAYVAAGPTPELVRATSLQEGDLMVEYAVRVAEVSRVVQGKLRVTDAAGSTYFFDAEQQVKVQR